MQFSGTTNSYFLKISVLLVALCVGYSLFAQTTLVLRPANGKDCSIDSRQNTTNFANHPDFFASAWTVGGVPTNNRGLIDFDLSAIPQGAIILSAKFSLYVPTSSLNGQHSSLTGPNVAELNLITSPWDHTTVTWDSQPTYSTNNQIILPVSTSPTQDYVDINVTNYVQQMYSDPANAHGFIFKQQTENFYRRLVFASSNVANAGHHPKLEIVYIMGALVNISGDTLVCRGDSTTLKATGATSFKWAMATNPTTIISTTDSLRVSPTVQTTYYAYSLTDTAEHTVNPISYQIELGPDTTLCGSNELLLDATTPNANYTWQDGSSLAIFNVIQAGQYFVTVDVNGCVGSDTIEVNYSVGPQINLGPDTTICDGQELEFNLNSPNTTFLWHNGSNDSVFKSSTPGTYWVRGVADGCEVTDTVHVFENKDQFFDLGDSTEACQGYGFTIGAPLAGAVYMWSTASTDSMIEVNKTGTYILNRTVNGCLGSDEIFVEIKETPALDLGADGEVCEEDEFVFNVTQANLDAEYKWHDGSTGPTFEVDQSGVYHVEIRIGNCFSNDTVHLELVDCDPDIPVVLKMPNIFTPNGDGINDIFQPVEVSGMYKMRTTIYNRWGEEVFRSFDAQILWTGEGLNEGTYLWRVDYEGIQGEVGSEQGSVNLSK